MYQQIQGDITMVQGRCIIVQQVNCQNVMNAGLAKAIATKYPIVKAQYHIYCNNHNKAESLLGAVQFVEVGNGVIVANLFGQLYYGRSGLFTDYKAVKEALESIYKYAENNDIEDIYIPYGLGCGLAGGDWSIIRSNVLDLATDYAMSIITTIVSLQPIDLSCGIIKCDETNQVLNWEKKLQPNINIISSKNLTDELINWLIYHKDKVVFRHTISGFGGLSIEPGIPETKHSFEQARKLFDLGFPTSRYVIDISPIIPTKIGTQRAVNVIKNFSQAFGIKNMRCIFLDATDDVREFFESVGSTIPWDGLKVPAELQQNFIDAIKPYDGTYYTKPGCQATVHFKNMTDAKRDFASELDYEILGLILPSNIDIALLQIIE